MTGLRRVLGRVHGLWTRRSSNARADHHAESSAAGADPQDEPLVVRFPWYSRLSDQLRRLTDQSIEERRAELEGIGEYLESSEGAGGLRRLEQALVNGGLPASAAGAEVELVREIFRAETLRGMLSNPAAGMVEFDAQAGTEHRVGAASRPAPESRDRSELWDRGAAAGIAHDFALTRAPIGPVLIIGSGNTLLPAVTAVALAYLAGNPVVLQAARAHRDALPAWFDELPWPGRETLHFSGLDHTRQQEARALHRLVCEVPWGAVNLWGGRAVLDALVPQIARNPQRPRIVAMEPLTGVALLQPRQAESNTAAALASAVSIMGQQLCSSPTEGYVVADVLSTEAAMSWTRDVARRITAQLAEETSTVALPSRTAIQLDRMLQAAEQAGTEVVRAPDGRSDAAVLISRERSVFERSPGIPAVGIHERRRVIELIVVGDFASVEALISTLPERPTHREIQRVQTILSLGDPDFIQRSIAVARRVGAYRVIDEAYVLRRHTFEPLDGRHLLNEFSRQIGVVGRPARVVTGTEL